MKKYKLGLDIHGVVDNNPKFWSVITKLLIDNGHQVHILTGSKITQKILDKLNKNKIYYTHLFSIIDHHVKIGTKIKWSDDNNPWIDDELWNKTKSEYCLKKKIDFMIDDTSIYAEFAKTPWAIFVNKKARWDKGDKIKIIAGTKYLNKQGVLEKITNIKGKKYKGIIQYQKFFVKMSNGKIEDFYQIDLENLERFN